MRPARGLSISAITRNTPEENGLAFEGISATSAGAMNGTVLAYGLSVGGREGARKALTEYWRRISEAAGRGPLQPSPIDRMLKGFSLRWSPSLCWKFGDDRTSL
jgi:NTE family protein